MLGESCRDLQQARRRASLLRLRLRLRGAPAGQAAVNGAPERLAVAYVHLANDVLLQQLLVAAVAVPPYAERLALPRGVVHLLRRLQRRQLGLARSALR